MPEKNGLQAAKKRSDREWVSLIAFALVFGIVVTVYGALLNLTEVIRGNWLYAGSTPNQDFFILTVGLIFLGCGVLMLYMEFEERQTRKRFAEDQQIEDKGDPGVSWW